MRFLARMMNSSRVTEPSSPLARTRTLTEPVADSLSPMIRMKGIFLDAEVAYFALHLVVAGVDFDAEAGGFEALLH